MKKFLLFVFAAVFISNSSNAYPRDDVRRDNGFYDEYHQGYGRSHREEEGGRMSYTEQERMHYGDRVDRRFRLRKGAPSQKRKYSKRELHKQKMHRMKRRLSKLPPIKRDAALREIERHYQEMGRIIGDDKRFPEFRGHGMRKVQPHVKPRVKPMPKKANPVPKRVKQDPVAAPKNSPAVPLAPASDSEQKNQSRNINIKWRYPKKMV